MTVDVSTVSQIVDVKISPEGETTGIEWDSGQSVTVAVETVLHSVSVKTPVGGVSLAADIQCSMCSENSATFEAGISSSLAIWATGIPVKCSAFPSEGDVDGHEADLIPSGGTTLFGAK